MWSSVKRFLDELQITRGEIRVLITTSLILLFYVGFKLWIGQNLNLPAPDPALMQKFKAVADSALKADSLEMLKFTHPEQYLQVVEKPKKQSKSELVGTLKVNINAANLDQLTRLPGIGPSTARNILEYRAQHGSFTNIDELTKVKRIGPKTLEKIRPFVSLKDK